MLIFVLIDIMAASDEGSGQVRDMQLGWVDFSKEDREKVLDVMNLLQEQGAVDEIGIGMIRDAFANRFFPGTSTIQTVAKYFLIVSYVLKEATEGRYGSDLNRILRRIDQEEKECGIRLMQNCPGEEGIIGRRVLPQNWVARKPSNIYWNGICTYGICKRNLTIPELIRVSVLLQGQKRASALGNSGDEAAGPERDDADAGREAAVQLFSVPDDYYGDWRSALSIHLTASEAGFLRSKIESNVASSFLAYILKNSVDVDKYTSFEAIYEDLGGSVPAELGRTMKLAYDFNRLVYTARVRYNYILSNGQNDAAAAEWQTIEGKMPYMLSVDIDEVLQTLRISNFRLRRFLIGFQSSLAAGSLADADQILIGREIEIKSRSRAKLCKRDDYANDVWIGGRLLDYRFSSAKRIITDIYRGERDEHA